MSETQTISEKFSFMEGSLLGVGPKAVSITGSPAFFARFMSSVAGEAKDPNTASEPTVQAALLQRSKAFAKLYAELLTDFGHPVTAESHLVFIPKDDQMICRLFLSYWSKQGTLEALRYLSSLSWEASDCARLSAEVPALTERILKESAPAGLNTAGLVLNLWAKKINAFEITPNTLCIGTGRFSRLMRSTSTDQTSYISVRLCRNKLDTESILALHGLPTANGVLVQSTEQAQAYADDIGYPVVVKPVAEDRGKGVFSNLRDTSEVARAIENGQKVSNTLMIERHVSGYTHRLTFADGELIHARKRRPGGVIGDGVSTLRILVDRKKEEPESQTWRRRLGHFPIELDEEALELLASLQKSADDVLMRDEFVPLRRRDNVNSGGASVPLPLEAIHSSNVEMAKRAMHHLRLNIGGIDIITEDISVPWYDNGAIICEVNAIPQMSGLNTPDDHFRLLDLILPNGARHVPVYVFVVPHVVTAEDVSSVANHCGVSAVAFPEGILNNGLFRACKSLSDACRSLASDTDIAAFGVVTTASNLFARGFPLSYANSVELLEKSEFTPSDIAVLQNTFSKLGKENAQTESSASDVHVPLD